MAPSIGRRSPRLAFAAVAAGALLAAVLTAPTGSAATPPGGTVSDAPLTAAQLLSGASASGLTRNDRFAPSGDATSAPPLAGTLQLAGATMGVLSDGPGGTISNPVAGKDTTFFPDVRLGLFTVGSRLVPTTQNVIRNGVLAGTRSYWDVIVQPGRVWTQPGDHGWHRASFPFALVNSIEGETHSGIAVFLYRGHRVSPVRFQIVQQTSPFDVPEYFTAWGTTAATYRPGLRHLPALRQGFRATQRARWPERPLSALRRSVDPGTLADFTSYDDVIAAAAVVRGTIYRTSCPTAAGPLPYCGEVRYGVWSETKSALLNVALFRLAQKFGPGLLDAPVTRYLPRAAAAGWRGVRIADLADMASGHGPSGDGTCYLCDYNRWYLAPSEPAKTAEALDYPRFTKPGTLFNYRDQDAYLLGVVLDNVLAAHEGPGASVYDMVRTEVYSRIGIHVAPTNTTVDSEGVDDVGQPLMAYGYYPTLDDLAKIAALYQHGGSWHGRQLLNRSLVQRLLPRSEPSGALPASDDGSHFYQLDWHIRRIDASPGCTRYLPQMEGWGGNTTTLLPGGSTLIRMRNNWVGDTTDPQESINAVGAQLSRVCGGAG